MYYQSGTNRCSVIKISSICRLIYHLLDVYLTGDLARIHTETSNTSVGGRGATRWSALIRTGPADYLQHLCVATMASLLCNGTANKPVDLVPSGLVSLRPNPSGTRPCVINPSGNCYLSEWIPLSSQPCYSSLHPIFYKILFIFRSFLGASVFVQSGEGKHPCPLPGNYYVDFQHGSLSRVTSQPAEFHTFCAFQFRTAKTVVSLRVLHGGWVFQINSSVSWQSTHSPSHL